MKRVIVIFVSIVLLTVGVFSFSPYAFAFDDEYISNAGKWYKTGTVISIENKIVTGQLHYIFDKKSGCAYFYFSYSNCDGVYNDDDVELEFRITNSKNNYSFNVSKSGVRNEDISKSFYVDYDFDNINSDLGNGRLFAGFEFKNKTDKSLLNHITCTFKAGNKASCTVMDSVPFDMSVEQSTNTSRATSAKSTTKKSSSKVNTTIAPNSAKSKDKSKSVKKETTKFVPKRRTVNTKSRKYNAGEVTGASSTKFSGQSDLSSSLALNENNIVNDTATTINTTQDTTYNFKSNHGTLSMSKASKRMLPIAGVCGVLGLVFMIYGIFSKSNKSKTSADNSSDSNS